MTDVDLCRIGLSDKATHVVLSMQMVRRLWPSGASDIALI